MSGAPLNSGPAFPVPSGAYSHGMSLRDWFAGQALPTILRSTYSLTTVTQEQAVRDAVEYAYDAVMGLCPTCDGLGAVEDEHPEPQTVADALAREGETAPSAPSDYLDTYEVLALAAAELKCAADTILATRCIPEALLGTTLARLDAAAAVVRAMKERTT